jgi:hypothetical protein
MWHVPQIIHLIHKNPPSRPRRLTLCLQSGRNRKRPTRQKNESNKDLHNIISQQPLNPRKMKTTLTLLLVFLMGAVTFTQAQSKKELEKNYAACASARDSLQKSLTSLSAEHKALLSTYDSVNKVCIMLTELETSVKSKTAEIKKTLNDSISALNKENTALRMKMDVWKAEYVNRTHVLYDLKQLKELLDQQIITVDEFEAKKSKLLEKL